MPPTPDHGSPHQVYICPVASHKPHTRKDTTSSLPITSLSISNQTQSTRTYWHTQLHTTADFRRFCLLARTHHTPSSWLYTPTNVDTSNQTIALTHPSHYAQKSTKHFDIYTHNIHTSKPSSSATCSTPSTTLITM